MKITTKSIPSRHSPGRHPPIVSTVRAGTARDLRSPKRRKTVRCSRVRCSGASWWGEETRPKNVADFETSPLVCRWKKTVGEGGWLTSAGPFSLRCFGLVDA